VAAGCVDPVGRREFGWVKTDSKAEVARGGEVAERDRMAPWPIKIQNSFRRHPFRLSDCP
jgi:hypothetical protein